MENNNTKKQMKLHKSIKKNKIKKNKKEKTKKYKIKNTRVPYIEI